MVVMYGLLFPTEHPRSSPYEATSSMPTQTGTNKVGPTRLALGSP